MSKKSNVKRRAMSKKDLTFYLERAQGSVDEAEADEFLAMAQAAMAVLPNTPDVDKVFGQVDRFWHPEEERYRYE